jgi:hypothetical protein
MAAADEQLPEGIRPTLEAGVLTNALPPGLDQSQSRRALPDMRSAHVGRDDAHEYVRGGGILLQAAETSSRTLVSGHVGDDSTDCARSTGSTSGGEKKRPPLHV